jgi:two-component system, chemotaxis family, protein-glutamate methylesterase/glutaminase
MTNINVVIVDDSALVRQVLSEFIKGSPGLHLLFAASDPIFAMSKMKDTWPDVIVLDIEMPRMDGITFLKKIMSERPTPVVICSSLTQKDADATFLAMEAGAVDIITKPQLGLKSFLEESKNNFINTIKAAASSNLKLLKKGLGFSKPIADIAKQEFHKKTVIFTTTEKVIAIGTSTGGTVALEHILKDLPHDSPGILIVQHMPEKFTATFANRLNQISEMEVKEAQHLDKVRSGLALVAPGNKHMVLKRSGTNYYVEIIDGPHVSRHRPSVDVLFRSVAKAAGKNSVGIIMTGMGDDGSTGIKEMFDEGAFTIAQDESTCIVFGMPKEAIKKGGIHKIVKLNEIAGEIVKYRSK